MPNRSCAQFESRLRQLEAPAGWCAWLLEAEYPVEHERAQAYRDQVQSLLDASDVFFPPWRQQVLLQFDRLRPGEDVALLRHNASLWLPDIGLGVWPHREAPRLWSREEFLDTPMQELRPIMHRMLRVDSNPAATRSAWETMLGLGVLRIASQDPDRFYRQAEERSQARIVEPAFQSFPFYVPLLEVRGLTELPASEVHGWLEGIDAYVRESSEDGGLLLLLRAAPALYFERLVASDRRAGLHREILRLPHEVEWP